MPKLNKTQAAVLSAAAGRRDHLLVPPKELNERAAKALGTTLLNLGLVAEVQVKRKEPAWRTGEDGIRVGLVLTEPGLRAVRPDPGPGQAEGETPPTAATPNPSDGEEGSPSAPADMPRQGTKQALILALLRRPTGAGLDELVAATGWLPHTTRAALTGLRQRGFGVYRHKGQDGRSVYLITDGGEVPASEAA